MFKPFAGIIGQPTERRPGMRCWERLLVERYLFMGPAVDRKEVVESIYPLLVERPPMCQSTPMEHTGHIVTDSPPPAQPFVSTNTTNHLITLIILLIRVAQSLDNQTVVLPQ